MSRTYVTGGAGFIGSHLADKLLELGHKVTIIDDLSSGKRENISYGAEFWDKDIHSVTKEDFEEGSVVFHLAAIASVPKSVQFPRETHETNVDGTFQVINSARKAKVKKIIFASSSAVYGNNKLPFREDDIPNPISPYAVHKLIGEQYLKLFDETYDLPTISLRFFNVYGPRCDPNSDYSLVISKFKKMKEGGRPLTIYGDGQQTRDFIYVSDVVDACIKAMETFARNEVINVCTGKSVSINEIADAIGGEKQYLPKRAGDAFATLGDYAKASKLLKWKPSISIEDGLNMF